MLLNSIARTVFANAKNLLIGFFFMLLISVPFILLNVYSPNTMDSYLQNINHYYFACGVLRWLGILLFILLWPSFVNYIGRKHQLTQEQIQFWQNERFLIAMWLIAFELLICENLIKKIIQLI